MTVSDCILYPVILYQQVFQQGTDLFLSPLKKCQGTKFSIKAMTGTFSGEVSPWFREVGQV